MPCVLGRAEMSSVRDVAMVLAFRHERGILYAVLANLSESTYRVRPILDPSSSPNLRSFNRTIVQNVSLEDLVELIEILKSKAAKHEAIL